MRLTPRSRQPFGSFVLRSRVAVGSHVASKTFPRGTANIKKNTPKLPKLNKPEQLQRDPLDAPHDLRLRRDEAPLLREPLLERRGGRHEDATPVHQRPGRGLGRVARAVEAVAEAGEGLHGVQPLQSEELPRAKRLLAVVRRARRDEAGAYKPWIPRGNDRRRRRRAALQLERAARGSAKRGYLLAGQAAGTARPQHVCR